MSKGSALFAELTEEAQKLNNEHRIETGENIAQLSAMLASLFERIKTLEEVFKNISDELPKV